MADRAGHSHSRNWTEPSHSILHQLFPVIMWRIPLMDFKQIWNRTVLERAVLTVGESSLWGISKKMLYRVAPMCGFSIWEWE